MKLFKVSFVKDGSWTVPVMVRETRIGAFIRDASETPGMGFNVEFVAEEEKAPGTTKDNADVPAAEPATSAGAN